MRHVKNSIGSDARTVLTATDASILLEAVKSGVGLGILPVRLATKDPALVPVQHNQIRLERVLHLHLNPDTLGMARVQAVVQWLEDEAEEAFGATKLKRSKQAQKLLDGLNR